MSRENVGGTLKNNKPLLIFFNSQKCGQRIRKPKKIKSIALSQKQNPETGLILK